MPNQNRPSRDPDFKLGIWGTGAEAERAIQDLEVQPVRVFDNSAEKRGSLCFGVPVEGIETLDDSLDELIICSMYYIDIVDQAVAHGFPLQKISIFFRRYYPSREIPESLEKVRENRHFTEDYRATKLAEVQAFGENREDFLRLAMDHRLPGGMILEFGVLRGVSIRFLASLTDEPIVGFDSFEGLPEDWTVGYPKGHFDLGRKLPSVPSNVSLLAGWFSDTLDGFLENEDGWISFLHMDADLYSSNTFVLGRLKERLRPGTVIVFDEYLCFTDTTLGDFNAFRDFIAESGMTYKYLAHSLWRVALQITAT